MRLAKTTKTFKSFNRVLYQIVHPINPLQEFYGVLRQKLPKNKQNEGFTLRFPYKPLTRALYSCVDGKTFKPVKTTELSSDPVNNVQDQLTTRQVAQALSVSESSVKRWCDRGLIPTVRTLGGHRRVPLSGFVKFLEETNREVITPIPGLEELPQTRKPVEGTKLEEQRKKFHSSLVAGDEDSCREVLSDWYAHHESFALMADEYIASALTQIGEAWDCGELEVYQERRACEICARLLYEFRRLIPTAPNNAPLAMGGTPEGDHYTLATQAVEIVLRECRWKSINLGPNLPFETLLAAASEHKPRLLWLSVSHIDDQKLFIEQYKNFSDQLPEEMLLVVGGRAMNDQLRPQLKFTGYCDTMQQLSSFATALHGKRHSINASEN